MFKTVALVLICIPLLTGCSPSISQKNVHSLQGSKLATTDSLENADDRPSAIGQMVPGLTDESANYTLSLAAVKFVEFADSIAASLVVSKQVGIATLTASRQSNLPDYATGFHKR